MNKENVQPGDSVFVMNAYWNAVGKRTVSRVCDSGVMLNGNLMIEFPWRDVFDSEAGAVAAMLARAEQEVRRAKRELKNAENRLAKLRQKYPVGASA